jgi:hypothetical protein
LGDTLTQRSMCALIESGPTATGKWSASVTRRVSATWNGMSRTCFVATSILWMPPAAQNTIDLESAVHDIPG